MITFYKEWRFKKWTCLLVSRCHLVSKFEKCYIGRRSYSAFNAKFAKDLWVLQRNVEVCVIYSSPYRQEVWQESQCGLLPLHQLLLWNSAAYLWIGIVVLRLGYTTFPYFWSFLVNSWFQQLFRIAPCIDFYVRR